MKMIPDVPHSVLDDAKAVGETHRARYVHAWRERQTYDCLICGGQYNGEEVIFKYRDNSCDCGPVCVHCFETLALTYLAADSCPCRPVLVVDREAGATLNIAHQAGCHRADPPDPDNPFAA